MTRIAVAAGTPLGADAGGAVAGAGGNAVDAAVAATFMTWVCEPGLTSMGSGGFCCVWPPDEAAVTIDGFTEMPGRSADPARFGSAKRITMPYGGQTDTIIGPGSVGTPGALAAIELVWRRWGRMPWDELIQPAIAVARAGFPLPVVSQRYFIASGEAIYSETPGAQHLYLRADGTRREAGELIPMPDLADALEHVAASGAEALYRGDLGATIAQWITDHGGLLGRDDFQQYRAAALPCLETTTGRWRLATNPPPAVGGVVLIELAALMGDRPRTKWTAPDVALFARVMELAFGDRSRLRADEDPHATAAELLDSAIEQRRRALASPSTSHTSAVDSDGLACSITTSTGYGSGVVVPGTGIMLNNVLGEIALSPNGLHTTEPGRRLRSTMAPSVVRSDTGHVIAFGAAGADRITSAMAQVWLNTANLGMSLQHAVAHPRCHLEWIDGEPVVAHEPGVDVSAVPFTTRAFDEIYMYFGGVQAAERAPSGELVAVADPRRGGGSTVSES